MKAYYATDTGKVRSHNEDNVIAVATEDNDYLLVVSDGMGGHRAGEVASMIATTYLADNFMKIKLETVDEAKKWLAESTQIINKKILDYAVENPSTKGMGTTCVVALINTRYTLIGNIGDSRAYIITNNELIQLTVDHTLVNLLVEAGELTEEEARFHPRRNVLMKALGSDMKVTMDLYEITEDYEAVLLCSDGLSNVLTKSEIIGIIKKEKEVSKIVNRLITRANNKGGSDNISVAFLSNLEE